MSEAEIPWLLTSYELKKVLGMRPAHFKKFLDVLARTTLRDRISVESSNVIALLKDTIAGLPPQGIEAMVLDLIRGKDRLLRPDEAARLIGLPRKVLPLVYGLVYNQVQAAGKGRYLQSSVESRGAAQRLGWFPSLAFYELSLLFGHHPISLPRCASMTALQDKIKVVNRQAQIETSEALEFFKTCLSDELRPQARQIASALIARTDSLISTRQVSRLWSVSDSTVRRRSNRGLLSCCTLTLPGGNRRFIKSRIPNPDFGA